MFRSFLEAPNIARMEATTKADRADQVARAALAETRAASAKADANASVAAEAAKELAANEAKEESGRLRLETLCSAVERSAAAVAKSNKAARAAMNAWRAEAKVAEQTLLVRLATKFIENEVAGKDAEGNRYGSVWQALKA